jgi:hypothetical protein
MDLTLREGSQIKFRMKMMLVISHDNNYSYTLLVNWYNNRLLPLIN